MTDPSKTNQELLEEISALQQRIKELEHSESQRQIEHDYQTLFREMLEGFALHEILCDTQGHPIDYRFLKVNPAFERITGLNAERIIGRTILEVLPGTERHWIDTYGLVALTGEPTFFENYSQTLDKYFLVTAFQPLPNQFACIFVDITDRKQAQGAQRKSEDKYRLIADNMADVIAVLDMNLRFTYISPSIFQLRGFKVDEAMQQTLDQVMPPESLRLASQAFAEEMLMEVSETVEPDRSPRIELEEYRKDGSRIWVEINASYLRDKDGKPTSILTVTRDITDRKQAQEALQESEKKFRLAFENAQDAIIWASSETGVIMDCNAAATELFEKPKGELVGSQQITLHPPGKAEHYRDMFEDHTRYLSSSGVEAQIITSSGIIRTVTINVSKTEFEGHKIIQGIFRDISDRKRAEDLIQESKEQYRLLTENIKDVVWILDTETMYFRYVSPSVEGLRGYTPEEILAEPVTQALTAEAAANLINLIRSRSEDVRSGKELPGKFYTNEVEQPCKDGSTVWTEVITSYYINPKNDRVEVRGVTRDISERKNAEEQIKSSLKEKEVLLKELQHRVKNNLLTITGILALQLERIKDRESKDIFITSMNRIKAMTRIHTRLYQSGNYSHINFKGYIEELAWELSRSYGFPPENMITDIEDISIDINTAIPAGLIVNELVSNVMKHAFPSLGAEDKGTGQPYRDRNGKITITLKERPALQPAFAGETRTENSEAPHPPLVILTVSDNGIGFPAHIDFRNTESVGLSLLAKLVEQINGSMELTRENGTIFIITFSRI